jgi:cell shape-determining protein MreC
MKKFFLVGCILVLLLLIFFMPSYGWALRSFFSPRPIGEANPPSLVAQNEALLAQLAALQGIAAQLPNASPNYLRAMVYSRYPLNFRNELLLNVGANQGILADRGVVFQGILIGTIQETFSDSSLVETVFDANFKMPVRIGSAGYDGLLTGGAYPKITSIQKNAPLQRGEIVYSAAGGLPYGLPVAVIQATSTSPNGLFEEAVLSFAYDINAVQTVLIAK